jgi:hypothetical protein
MHNKNIIDPHLPTPFSPVHKHLKFSAVFGTTSARSSISMRPLDEPPIDMSKKTTGLSAMLLALGPSVSVGVNFVAGDFDSKGIYCFVSM